MYVYILLKQHFKCLYIFYYTCVKAGDPGSIPGSGRSPREGNGNPLPYFCLGNPTEEWPGGLQSMGLQRVQHDFAARQQQLVYLFLHC